MARGDLTNQQWVRLEPLLPSSDGKRGHPYKGHRQVLNGILWIARTGAPWRDLPERYGPWKTCHDRLLTWQAKGLWNQIFQALLAEVDAAGQLDWSQCSIDSTGHPCPPACGGSPSRSGPSRPRARPAGPKRGDSQAAREALGRSRGGFSTKLHIVFEGQGRPLSLRLTEGQRHDSTQLAATLAVIRVPRRRGRPRQRPDHLTGDKGYSYPKCRIVLRRRGIRHVIPERKDQREQRAKKGSAGGRPPRFEAARYALRSWAERGMNRLKQWRRIATRYEKRGANYLAFATLVTTVIWLGA